MRTLRGGLFALALLAAGFVLHIVGGATGQDWLFLFAVALVFVSAAGMAGIAGMFAAARPWELAAWGAIGAVLTASALWAANDRSWAWWTVPTAAGLEVAASAVLVVAVRGLAWRRSSETRKA